MKQLSGILLFAALFGGCGKVKNYSEGNFSAALFINASPSTSANFNVVVDGVNQASSIAYRTSTSYLNLRPGVRNVEIKSNNPALNVTYVSLPAENFDANTASTIIVYDTLASVSGTLKSIRLTDDLSVPADGSIKVRFIPLAVKAPPVDVTFVRTSVTPNDSVTISNQSYIGGAPSASTLETLARFTAIPAGNYIIKQKAAGTQTPLLAPAVLLDTRIGGVYRGIFTVYSTGTAGGQPLATNFVRHFP